MAVTAVNPTQMPGISRRHQQVVLRRRIQRTFIYLGVFLVIAMLWLTGRFRAGLYVPPTVRNILLGLTAAMILDGVNSFEHTHHLHAFYADSNALRAITGTLAGMSLTILVVPLFNRIV